MAKPNKKWLSVAQKPSGKKTPTESMAEKLNKFYQPWFDDEGPLSNYDNYDKYGAQYLSAKVYEEELLEYENKVNEHYSQKAAALATLKDHQDQQQKKAYDALLAKYEALKVAKTPEPIIKAETATVYVHGMLGTTTPVVLKPGMSLQIKTKDGYICAMVSVDKSPPAEEVVQEVVAGPRIVEV